jgi:hypothetical protein
MSSGAGVVGSVTAELLGRGRGHEVVAGPAGGVTVTSFAAPAPDHRPPSSPPAFGANELFRPTADLPTGAPA